MKLFSTSALLLASAPSQAFKLNQPETLTLSNQPALNEANLEPVSRFRREAAIPSAKEMKKKLQDSSISDGVKSLKQDLKSGKFRKVVRNHGAQSIVDPSRLTTAEQYQMHKILGKKEALTGRQLLYSLSTSNISEQDLEKFKKWQQYLLKNAKSFQAQNLALVGIRYNGDEEPEYEPNETEDIAETEVDVKSDQNNMTGSPQITGNPYKHPRNHNMNIMTQHPNKNYPSWAIQSFKPTPPPNFVTNRHPNANYPSYAIQKVGPNFSTANMMPRPPTAFLKSALNGRGLPRGAIARRPPPGAMRFQNADRESYKTNELNAMKKEARQTLVMIKSQTEKYNELVDLIKRAEVHVNNDNLLASVGSSNSNVPRPKPSSFQSTSRPSALQAEINRVNDELLVDLRNEAAQRRKAEFLKQKRQHIEEAQQKAKAQVEQYKAYITKRLALRQQANNDNLLEKVAQIANEAAQAEVEAVEEEMQIDDANEVHLNPEVDEPEVQEPKNEPEVDWNRNKLDQVKQLFIPPLSSIDFFTQYKIAMWLKDHKQITPDDYHNLSHVIPDPSLETISEYYYNQQKVLRREKLDGENSWMKKLRKTLWKGLKPDPLPTE